MATSSKSHQRTGEQAWGKVAKVVSGPDPNPSSNNQMDLGVVPADFASPLAGLVSKPIWLSASGLISLTQVGLDYRLKAGNRMSSLCIGLFYSMCTRLTLCWAALRPSA